MAAVIQGLQLRVHRVRDIQEDHLQVVPIREAQAAVHQAVRQEAVHPVRILHLQGAVPLVRTLRLQVAVDLTPVVAAAAAAVAGVVAVAAAADQDAGINKKHFP